MNVCMHCNLDTTSKDRFILQYFRLPWFWILHRQDGRYDGFSTTAAVRRTWTINLSVSRFGKDLKLRVCIADGGQVQQARAFGCEARNGVHELHLRSPKCWQGYCNSRYA